MTRRDYCGNCDELVGDDDVMCHSCENSYCAFCTTPYNAITRVAMVHARVNYTSYCMTEEELNAYIEDLNAISKDEDYLYYIRDYVYDGLPDFIQRLEQYLEQCKDLSQITKFICDSKKGYVVDFAADKFVCEGCHDIIELEHRCENASGAPK